MVHTGCFSMELTIVHLPVPHTPRLLYLASLGEPLPLDEENLFWVQTLLRAGYIRAAVVPDEHATRLVCRLTPLGESFLEYFNE
jgi:hypothetical protein